ncbi:uncharacterized protein MONOS_12257 [Monocercomonoides exilis]|uniref:uncharacterized protein n=1 Tax=Monocercomonoides exilis TaxID=2049356 RepID=UPI00355ABD29|nr:hypothetical protein MONOS_12257 [Monocercomonoides exilis]|eukprot:MONOS_12257.1-p1 / transcript=MONOS_12257.1 / gene=MONOS_12257 / organism=Monocercomonoides_exilis_PA203 / gene_product=unspecified product / transcript_product=unspecified product / location=Mono_scaffold00666:6041-6430(+) / protein_length=130 / sequence_SO=supercontig / SO=protein_coding / is_pseudo=false
MNSASPPPIAPLIFTLPSQNVDQSHEGRIAEENEEEGAKEDIDMMDDILMAINITDPTISFFDLKLSRSELEDETTFYNELDFNPVISKSPPAAVRSQFWYRDALDKAGEQVERYFFQPTKQCYYPFRT